MKIQRGPSFSFDVVGKYDKPISCTEKSSVCAENVEDSVEHLCDDNEEQFYAGLVEEQELSKHCALYDSSDYCKSSEEVQILILTMTVTEKETKRNSPELRIFSDVGHWIRIFHCQRCPHYVKDKNSWHPCFNNLPVDGRTPMKNPGTLNEDIVSPGFYIHIGLVKQLTVIGNTQKNTSTTNLGLLFNIDGLPLFCSSQSELYPVMFTIPNLRELKTGVFLQVCTMVKKTERFKCVPNNLHYRIKFFNF